MRFLWTLVVLVGLSFVVTKAKSTSNVLCYYGSWATYRNGDGKFSVEDIDTSLCTHLIYSFVGLNTDGSIKILDTWNEITQNAFGRFTGLKSRNRNLKTMVAIGGWNEGSTTFSNLVNSPSLRSRFVNEAVAFLKKYNFDGLDLDWEYPAQRGGAPSDRQAFSELIKELSNKFRPNGYILSAAVGATLSHRRQSYDVPKLSQYLDFINLMSYELHGTWDGVTGQNAPLYDKNSALSVSSIVKDWISAGAAPEKLVLGIGLYGRTFTLASSGNNGVGARISGPGSPGQFSQQPGMLSYNEICRNRWSEIWDDNQKVPYAYQGNQWVGYDNARSVALKAQFAVSNKLGGVMVWSIESDDKSGVCDGRNFPLMRSIKNVINSDGDSSSSSSSSSVGSSSGPNSTNGSNSSNGQQTQRPQTTPGNPCYKEGFVADPKNCRIFYLCKRSGNLFAIRKRYSCPKNRFFNSKLNACNFECV